MEVDSLADVKAAFEEWRSKKSHPREAIPGALMEMARAAARRHGPAVVARATKVDRARLSAGLGSRARRGARAGRVPAYSRLEIEAPGAAIRPFAELEMPTGLTVRLFTQTHETLALVSSLCGTGGAR
jgi:hypothetical protein